MCCGAAGKFILDFLHWGEDLSIGPNDLIACAGACASGDEAHRRAAISRAYYAAYHDSNAWATQHNVGPALTPTDKSGKPVQGMHAVFIAGLKQPSMALPRTLRLQSSRCGIFLAILHQKRIRADYDIGVEVPIEDAFQAIQDAQQVLAI